MKKIISFFSTIILLLLLASCGGASNATSFDSGKFDNKNYINDWINISVPQDDGWIIIPDDQLSQMYSNPTNVVIGLGESKNKEFETGKATGLYPIGFVNSSTNANLLIAIEKISSSGNDVVNNYLSNLKTQLKQLETQGLVYTVNDPKTTTIGSFECTQVEAIADYNGSKIIQNYYLKHKGNFLFALITTSPSDKGTETINKLLSNIKNAK